MQPYRTFNICLSYIVRLLNVVWFPLSYARQAQLNKSVISDTFHVTRGTHLIPPQCSIAHNKGLNKGFVHQK
jgi:hypothetical protein